MRRVRERSEKIRQIAGRDKDRPVHGHAWISRIGRSALNAEALGGSENRLVRVDAGVTVLKCLAFLINGEGVVGQGGMIPGVDETIADIGVVYSRTGHQYVAESVQIDVQLVGMAV